MLHTVSFWIFFWSALIGLVVGSFTHWIFGVIIFFLFVGKTMMIGLIMDVISGSLTYHHNREDLRMKKTLESMRYLNAMNAGVRPVQTKSFKKFII